MGTKRVCVIAFGFATSLAKTLGHDKQKSGGDGIEANRTVHMHGA
jgi:hypothetical protein